MDHDAYKKTYRDINERYCMFEKAILSSQCACAQASRFCLAEREGIHCRSDEAQRHCEELIVLLRHHARFTLKAGSESGALPHAKAMRIQVGGLKGLHTAVKETDPPSVIDNIFELIGQALKKYNDLAKLPFQEIIKQVAAYKGRKRH